MNTLPNLISTIRAVIFDMDGTLVDSESHHFRAHKAAIEEQGGHLTEDFYSAHGVSRSPYLFYSDLFPDKKNDRAFLENIYKRKLVIFQTLQEKEGIIGIEPALSLVKFLFAKHIPLAVGTAVHKTEAMKNLVSLQIDHYFQAVVTFDDVGEKRKPDPAIYLRVSELLEIPPNQCLVIEDSENGVKAAVAAHMYCVAVPHTLTKNHDFTGAIVVSSFDIIKNAFDI